MNPNKIKSSIPGMEDSANWQTDPHTNSRRQLRSIFKGFSALLGLFVLTGLGIYIFGGVSNNDDTTAEALIVAIHARGDTGEEELSLLIDGELVEIFDLSDNFKKYSYEHPFAVASDDVAVAFENDGLTASGEIKGVKLDYIDLNGSKLTTKQAADYQISDLASPECSNASKDPTEVDCSGVFNFDIGDSGRLADIAMANHRISVSAHGVTGDEILVLKIKDQEVQRWTMTSVYKSYNYAYSGTLGSKDIKIEFINDARDRNIDVDYIKVNNTVFQAEADTVYSTGTYTADTGCAPGFKKKARLSCNGYMQFDIGSLATPAEGPIAQSPIDETPSSSDDRNDVELTKDDEHSHDSGDQSHSPIPQPVVADKDDDIPVQEDEIAKEDDPSIFGGVNPVSPIAPGNIALSSFNNPLVPSSSLFSTPSRSLNIGSLTDSFNGNLQKHRKEGQFRTRCQYSHVAYDDPIVFPGKPGVAHLHMFFGNTNTNGNTTTSSLLNSGGGSCQGGELNRTAYWIPALFDGKGQVRVPFDFVAYYKTPEPNKVEAMPVGLKMLTGTAANTKKISWSCAGSRSVLTEYNRGNTIPECRSGDYLKAGIGFPYCWDGRLDSNDHKAHLAYPDKNGCPSSHKRVLPRITYNIYWNQDGNSDDWYLSSDRFNGARASNGSTLHADWFGGWNETTMNLWTKNCTQAQVNCGVGPISSTQKLKSFSNDDRFKGPDTLPRSTQLAPQRP